MSPALLAAAVVAAALVRSGSADALDGRIVHAKGAVVAVAGDAAWSPLAPKKSIAVPPGETIADDPAACREAKVDAGAIALGDGETAAAIATGRVGSLADATVVLVRGKRADDIFGYAPMSVRVYSGKDHILRAETDVDVVAYPCALVLDDVDGKPGNEISVAWISLGGSGYTAGVTVFSLR
jgi:hypothetical protein